jgi:gamma-glutamylputrescine oxidase
MKSIWQKLQLASTFKKNKKYDFTIIGSGIAGMSCAYWLEKKYHDCSILIIDKGNIAEGASGRNAGFLTGGSPFYLLSLLDKYGDKAFSKWAFVQENIQSIYSEFPGFAFDKSGTTTLFDEKDKFERLQELSKCNDHNIQECAPYFDFNYAFQTLNDSSFDPFAFILAIKEKLQRTDFLFDHEVKSLDEYRGSKIVATNSELQKLLPNLEVEPKRAQIAFYEVNTNIKGNFSIPTERIYFRKHMNGILMGGLRLIDEESENTNEIKVNSKIQSALDERIRNYFGEFQNKTAWCGIMGFTQDEYPLYGQVDNHFYIGGFSGHGNGYAFSMAKNLVDTL